MYIVLLNKQDIQEWQMSKKWSSKLTGLRDYSLSLYCGSKRAAPR